MKIAAYVVAGLLGLIVVIFAAGLAYGPKTYKELADDYSVQCVRNKGYGGWVGSSGLSLEEFCEGVGNAKALLDHRRDHPEAY